MISAVSMLAVAAIVGFPIARLLLRDEPVSVAIGSGFLAGLLSASLSMLGLSAIGLEWSLLSFYSSQLLIGVIAWTLYQRREPRERESDVLPRSISALTINAFTALIVGGYARFATAAPLFDSDYLTIWGLKARTFWEAGGVDWSFLESDWNLIALPDYPIALPLLFNAMNLGNAQWDDRSIGLLYPLLGAALLFVGYGIMRSETGSPIFASVATLALAPAALAPWVGLGEGPLVSFGVSGLLLLRRASIRDDRGVYAMSAMLLGGASLMKNEGLAWLVASLVAFMLTRRSRWRAVIHLWPALPIAGSWLLLRLQHELPTVLLSGSLIERMTFQIAKNRHGLISALRDAPVGDGLFWGGVVIGLVAFIWSAESRDRMLLLACSMQVCFYLAAYLVTPYDLQWHVKWSSMRLVFHLMYAAGFAILSMCAAEILRSRRIQPSPAPA